MEPRWFGRVRHTAIAQIDISSKLIGTGAMADYTRSAGGWRGFLGGAEWCTWTAAGETSGGGKSSEFVLRFCERALTGEQEETETHDMWPPTGTPLSG